MTHSVFEACINFMSDKMLSPSTYVPSQQVDVGYNWVFMGHGYKDEADQSHQSGIYKKKHKHYLKKGASVHVKYELNTGPLHKLF